MGRRVFGWCDGIADARVVLRDIHPFATLTRIYFENMLCLSPLVAPLHDTCDPKRTQVGVRVSLGDTGRFLPYHGTYAPQ